MILYRILISGIALWILSGLVLRGRFSALKQRLGAGYPARKQGASVWVHAASNGELASAQPVLRSLSKRMPGLSFFVTCNSESGVEAARKLGYPAAFAPLDLRWAVRRLLRRQGVLAHISLEAEIWPNRFGAIDGPVILLGGRMSVGTARGWGRVPALAARTLGGIDFASAQDAGSEARLRALGLRADATGPTTDLKALYLPPDRGSDAGIGLPELPRDETWLAASTHEGEDEVVVAAHLAARAACPGLRLILAPRHPRRADAIERLLKEADLAVARRSRAEVPEGAAVYLADTMGEMHLWYARAGRVFIGGTLTDRGGHTPYEPAHFGAALLHGPDVANFARPFARLRDANAAIEISDAAGLGEALVRLSDSRLRDALAANAREALAAEGDLDALVDRIAALLRDPSAGLAPGHEAAKLDR